MEPYHLGSLTVAKTIETSPCSTQGHLDLCFASSRIQQSYWLETAGGLEWRRVCCIILEILYQRKGIDGRGGSFQRGFWYLYFSSGKPCWSGRPFLQLNTAGPSLCSPNTRIQIPSPATGLVETDTKPKSVSETMFPVTFTSPDMMQFIFLLVLQSILAFFHPTKLFNLLLGQRIILTI